MKTLAIIFFAFVLTYPLQAQTLKERLNTLKEKTFKKKDKPERASQDDVDYTEVTVLLENFKEGQIPYFRIMNGMVEGFNGVPSGYATLNFERDKNNQVAAIWFQDCKKEDADIVFKANKYPDTETVLSYTQNAMQCLCITPETFIKYSMVKDSEAPNGFRVTRVTGIYGRKMGYEKAMKYVNEYRINYEKNLFAEWARKKKESADDRAKYTLAGKTISKIQPIWPKGKPSKISVGTSTPIGFEVTFADGTTEKTKNVGGNLYLEDFTVTAVNGSSYSIGNEYTTNQRGIYTNNERGSLRAEKSTPEGKDVVSYTVMSKYDKSAKATFSFPIEYRTSASLGFAGTPGGSNASSIGHYGCNGGDGGNGPTIYCNITTAQHSETGETYYVARAGEKGETTRYALFTKEFSIASEGGKGGDGCAGRDQSSSSSITDIPSNGGSGGDGGNGGTIHIYVAPEASSVNVRTNVEGGNKGGPGLAGICMSCPYDRNGKTGSYGSEGSDGTVIKSTVPLKF